MSSLATYLWTCIGFKSTSKRATPRVISIITEKSSSPSIHDRASYSAPALGSPQLAFESPLFKSHPSRFVSLSELISGLTPPGEVQLEDLESIEAEGEIAARDSDLNDLTKQLLKSLAYTYRPTSPVEAVPSQLSVFVSSLLAPKSTKPARPLLFLDAQEKEFCKKHEMTEEDYIEWFCSYGNVPEARGPKSFDDRFSKHYL
ncbi:hypothetical protein JCM11491_004596 [Sporobolomyces phaffii]